MAESDAMTTQSRTATAPLRNFLRTESGGAGVLVAAVAAALVWANVDNGSYQHLWHAAFSLRLGPVGISHDLRTWINSGLMTLFFLVVGLEARREIDLGELRDRTRMLLPFACGLLAMAVPIGLFLMINSGGPAVHGWGAAMSTDTALALGALSLVSRGVPDRIRIFLLTMFIVDDIASLVIIAVGYGQTIRPLPLLLALGFFALHVIALRAGVDRPSLYVLLGIAIWLALFASGVDPVVAGLAIGLTASAYTPSREHLENATVLFRQFREQPTAELARGAATGLTATLSPNARLERVYHAWTRYLIVPLFGLANAGIPLSAGFLAHAYRSPVTLGIIVAYVIGKPLAVIGGSVVITAASRGRLRPPVGWAGVVGGGLIAGTGFTVSFLIAARVFSGPLLDQAKLGVLSAGVIACLFTGAAFRIIALLSPARRARALLGDLEQITDLVTEVDPDRDHIRGPLDASVTVVEYGDFQCPYCGLAEAAIRADMERDDDVRYVWRHLPLPDVHPDAELAAQAAEAAGAQGRFWEMHDRLLSHQDDLGPAGLLEHARQLGLDVERFKNDLVRHVHSGRVAEDVESADLSGVSGTPTFFINGRRHHGAYDIDSLSSAAQLARSRAASAT